jgi:DNA polymerase (family 10)
MKNANIVSILRDIAFLLEMEDGEDNNSNIVFKIRSYRRASDTIANLSSNLEEIYREQGLKGLMQIPSIGKAIALKIEEYLTTGQIRYLDELKSKTDIDIDGFYGLEGIGPRTIKIVYDNLGIRDVSGLEKAASEGSYVTFAAFLIKRKK